MTKAVLAVCGACSLASCVAHPVGPARTYSTFPILVIANDPSYVGDKTNGRFLNAIASIYLVILVVVSIVTIPLLIITKGGTG